MRVRSLARLTARKTNRPSAITPSLEATRESVQAAEACSLFVSELNRRLPRKSKHELRRTSPSQVETWAARWNVLAPCVVERARSLAQFLMDHPNARKISLRDPLGDGYKGPDTPAEWSKHLKRAAQLPIALWRADVVFNVISEAEAEEELKVLQHQLAAFKPRPYRYQAYPSVRYHPRKGQSLVTSREDEEKFCPKASGWVDTYADFDEKSKQRILADGSSRQRRRPLRQAVATPAGSRPVHKPSLDEHLLRQRETFLRVELPRYRRELLAQDTVLAPLLADPLSESYEQCRARFEYHWKAHVIAALDLGYVDVTRKRELSRHIEWLIRYNVHCETFSQIAESCIESVTPDAVKMAVWRLAKLIGLQLRRVGRGGSRKKRPQQVIADLEAVSKPNRARSP